MKEANCVSFIDQDFDSRIENKAFFSRKKLQQVTGISNWDVFGRKKPGIGEKHDLENRAKSTVLSIPGFMGRSRFYCNDQNGFFFNRMFFH